MFFNSFNPFRLRFNTKVILIIHGVEIAFSAVQFVIRFFHILWNNQLGNPKKMKGKIKSPAKMAGARGWLAQQKWLTHLKFKPEWLVK